MFYKIKDYLIKAFFVQIIINLVSMPILIHWGLPISKMSFIGNLIFMPVLMIFLILSSIIFFTELLNIPNAIFINLLNKITNIWQKLLNLGQKSWLMSFSKQNLIILILIPVITFYILFSTKINSYTKKIIILTLFFVITIMSLKLIYTPKNKKVTIENKLIIKQTKNETKINDCGLFATKQSVEKFIEFKLKPEIIKNFGTLNIKSITLKKAGIRNFKALIECINLFEIKKVKLPFFKNNLSKYGWKLFFKMKNKLNENHIKFIRYKLNKK